MGTPVNLAAIDAGTNAIRLLVAHAASPKEVHVLESERAAVRLGHNVFTRRRIDARTMARAGKAFRRFRRLMEGFHVRSFRAVTTCAAREARNRSELVARVRRASGIELEVIGAAEESRLVRSAALAALGEGLSPRLIVDLGGGSLEISLLRHRKLEHSLALPVGTVRLMEMFGIDGALGEKEEDEIRRYLLAMLETRLPYRPDMRGGVAVACGGNAEALTLLAGGPPKAGGIRTLNFHRLAARLWQILSLDVPGRMKAFQVRRDRAEVMGIAAIIFHTLARWLGLREALVPCVGVREGVLNDLVAAHFGTEAGGEDNAGARAVLDGARGLLKRLGGDTKHAEQVRRQAVSLFQQLTTVHALTPEHGLELELGALLHDAGHFISHKAHNRHGEYLVRHAEIPGLAGRRRDLAACLVRYHNKTSDPDPGHKLYASFDGAERQRIRALVALLRIAEGLDCDHKQRVRGVSVTRTGKRVLFRVRLKRGSGAPIAAARRKAAMFEAEFGVKTRFQRQT